MDKTFDAVGEAEVLDTSGSDEAPGASDDCSEPGANWDPHVVALSDPTGPISKQYRALCRSITTVGARSAPRTILITSSGVGEGRSLTTLNLGVSFASKAGSRVLVVDADLRDPALHRLTGMENDGGLSDHLSGKLVLELAIRRTSVPNLSMIPAGRLCGNPTELLSGTALRDMIRRVSKTFDHVLIDSPGVVTFSDAAVIAPHTDGTLLVVRMGETLRQDVAQAQFLLKRVHANILGAVLTGEETADRG